MCRALRCLGGGVVCLLWRNKGRALREDGPTGPAISRAGLCEGSFEALRRILTSIFTQGVVQSSLSWRPRHRASGIGVEAGLQYSVGARSDLKKLGL